MFEFAELSLRMSTAVMQAERLLFWEKTQKPNVISYKLQKKQKKTKQC